MKFIPLIFVILMLSLAVHAKKTDVVVLINGDHITGEVKGLDFGLLTFKTDHMGTIDIEWDEIASLTALNQYFRLEREDGRLMYGSLDTDTLSSKLLVVLDTTKVPVDFLEIVRVTPIKETMWDRFELNLDLGYSYTKTTTISTLTFSGKSTYRAYRNSLQLNWTNITTEQQDIMRQELNRLRNENIYKERIE